MKLIALIVLMITAPTVIGDFINANKEHDIAQVKATCDYSRTVVSGYYEELCGRLQDQTNTEYICNATVTDCWVESK